MPVESATYISQLVPSNPVLTDGVFQGLNHIQLLKAVLQATFPNFSGPVNATPNQINAIEALFGASPGATLTLSPGSGQPGITIGTTSAGAYLNTNPAPTTATPNPSPIASLQFATDGSVSTPVGFSAGYLTATGAVSGASIQKNGSELLPTGVICMWSGAAASIPAGWYLCDGTNGTPDLRDRFIVGAGNSYSVGASGGSATQTLAVANLPAHNHGVNDPGHAHGVNDPGHTHQASVNDPGHAHGVNDPGHSHPERVGQSTGGGGVNGWNISPSQSLVNLGYNTGNANTGISINTAWTGIGVGIANATTGITIAQATTGITTQNTGSGSAFSLLPPYYALCFIMKA